MVDETKLFSTMDKQRGPVEKIHYGQDDNKLYFAFECNMTKSCSSDSMTIIIDPIDITGKINLKTEKTFFGNLEVDVACQDWLEVNIDKSKIDKDEISLRFEIEKDGIVVQTLPGFGVLKIDLGSDYSQNWFI
ncbi:MAG: hypothetical protein AUK54_03115 [Helicobacteraceae bacterium CG2_30_36_10]|nr:MAG: hypothetical protein AUK54_03115 [Helicobacteraceae bacterium CG2_30_36_10]